MLGGGGGWCARGKPKKLRGADDFDTARVREAGPRAGCRQRESDRRGPHGEWAAQTSTRGPDVGVLPAGSPAASPLRSVQLCLSFLLSSAARTAPTSPCAFAPLSAGSKNPRLPMSAGLPNPLRAAGETEASEITDLGTRRRLGRRTGTMPPQTPMGAR